MAEEPDGRATEHGTIQIEDVEAADRAPSIVLPRRASDEHTEVRQRLLAES